MWVNKCPPHHWLVSDPVVRYIRPNNQGDLVETTTWKCKKCDVERLNKCVLPMDAVAAEED